MKDFVHVHNPHRKMEPHSSFFSSLKRVEKRLKSEQSLQHTELKHKSSSSSADSVSQSLSTPLYLLSSNHRMTNDSDCNNPATIPDSSVPPQAFFSSSSEVLSTPHRNPRPIESPDSSDSRAECEIDDIAKLVKLLGMAEHVRKSQEKAERRDLGGEDDSFYEKIVGVKGPKSEKEAERLDGWIEHFMNGNNGEEVMEPLRLAHLLLGKSAFMHNSREDCGYGGLEFPDTVEDFLQNDPPSQGDRMVWSGLSRSIYEQPPNSSHPCKSSN